MTTMLSEEGPFTSKHLNGSAELLLVIPIKPGFVEVSETMSFAARLRDLLAAFFDFRKRTADITLKDTPQPIELLEIIYAAQWTVLENERKLVVAVTFDRSWEEYFARLEKITGYLLDALFMHCVGYAKHTSEDGFTSFTDWIRSHQRPTDFLFNSLSDLTASDVRSLRRLARSLGAAAFGEKPATLASFAEDHRIHSVVRDTVDGIPDADDLRLALRSLYDFRRFFPPTEEIQLRDGTVRSVQQIYDFAAGSLLQPVFKLKGKPIADLLQELRLQSPEVTAWVEAMDRVLRQIESTPEAPAPCPPVEPSEVQANILRALPEVEHGAALLIQCHGPGGLRALLDNQREEVSWEDGGVYDHSKPFRSLALTYGGLTRAQLPDRILKLFPKEFREGMEQRAGLLGDVGKPNHPHYWMRPLGDDGRRISMSAVDAVVVLQTANAQSLQDAIEALRASGDTHFSIVHVQMLKREALDAFGLKEGASQPRPPYTMNGQTANLTADVAIIDRVPLGELLLGYEDRFGKVATSVEGATRSLFHNGTFMVMRKLEQDAEQFNDFLDKAAAQSNTSAASMKDQIVGRRVAELIEAPNGRAVSNDFDYGNPDDDNDPAASRCPFHAHARLGNPRLKGKDHPRETPRILRRGVTYDDRNCDGDGGRGQLFMAYNASLTAQYETIQRWLNAGNITGLFSWQNDVLTGRQPPFPFPRKYQNGEHAGSVAAPAQPFVKLRWGLYLFVPSRAAMAWLSDSTPEVGTELDVQAGQTIIRQLQGLALVNAAEAVQEWKRMIEDPSFDLKANQVWSAIRALGGVLDTPYGRLIADEEHARTVLYDDGRTYSVDVYGHRLDETLGRHYLGLDAYTPEYAKLAEANAVANAALHDPYNAALEIARDILEKHSVCDDAGRKLLRIEDDFAKLVIRQLAVRWFGLPEGVIDGIDWFQHFVDLSRYSFQPHPQEWLAKKLRDQRSRMDVEQHYPVGGQLGTALMNAGYLAGDPAREHEIRIVLMGAVAGFSAPAIASIVSVLDKWIESDEIGWLAERLRQNGEAKSDFRRMLLEALARRPVPPLLYRTDRNDGARAVVGLGSVYRDAETRQQPEAWLFGGRNAWDERMRGGHSPHACPAREAGLEALLGAITALLEQRNLERESRAVVSFEPVKPA